jgi:hypothetical protein
MFGPNQGVGRRFIVVTHSNYPLCQKKVVGGMNFETTLLTPSNILFSRIWIDLSPPFRTTKKP